jgi:hypothetical protein
MATIEHDVSAIIKLFTASLTPLFRRIGLDENDKFFYRQSYRLQSKRLACM